MTNILFSISALCCPASSPKTIGRMRFPTAAGSAFPRLLVTLCCQYQHCSNHNIPCSLLQLRHRIHRFAILCQLEIHICPFHAVVFGRRRYGSDPITHSHIASFGDRYILQLTVSQFIAIAQIHDYHIPDRRIIADGSNAAIGRSRNTFTLIRCNDDRRVVLVLL